MNGKYEHAGEFLKVIRESREMTLKDVTDGICNYSTLQKFEAGTGNMRFRTVFQIIKNLGITLAEFHQVMSNYESDDFKVMINGAVEFYEQNNVEELTKIVEQLKHLIPETEKGQNSYFKLNYLMAKALLSQIDDTTQLSQEEKELIVGKLLFNEHWGYFELSLFGNVVKIFETEKLLELTNEMIERSKFYQAIPKNKHLASEILLNVMKILVVRRKYTEARKISEVIANMLDENHMYLKVVYGFTKGTLEFSDGNFELGLQMMADVIKILEILKVNVLLEEYRALYKQAEDSLKK